MNFIAINLTPIELVVLPVVVTIFAMALFFFIKSQRSLRQTLEENKLVFPPNLKKEKTTKHKPAGAAVMEPRISKKRLEIPRQDEEIAAFVSKRSKSPHEDEDIVQELKQTIAQQQKVLNSYLNKVEELENEGKDELQAQNEELQEKISLLEEAIDKKEDDIDALKQQAAASQKMSARIEEVYAEFEQLQAKMSLLEKQANRSNNLAIELEDTKGAFEAIHKELSRKQQKLEEVMEENQNIREEMNLLEDKLSEANFQRQQLQKKVQFLTDLNNDMQNISDTNKKLQTELRRIGELESMLNLMAEERDYLLKKKGR